VDPNRKEEHVGDNATQKANEDMGVANVQATAVEGRAADDVLSLYLLMELHKTL